MGLQDNLCWYKDILKTMHMRELQGAHEKRILGKRRCMGFKIFCTRRTLSLKSLFHEFLEACVLLPGTLL